MFLQMISVQSIIEEYLSVSKAWLESVTFMTASSTVLADFSIAVVAKEFIRVIVFFAAAEFVRQVRW